MGSVLDKVVGPDMVWALGTKPDAGAVIKPQTAAFGLFVGNDLSPANSSRFE
jgi:hypothetical protein